MWGLSRVVRQAHAGKVITAGKVGERANHTLQEGVEEGEMPGSLGTHVWGPVATLKPSEELQEGCRQQEAGSEFYFKCSFWLLCPK